MTRKFLLWLANAIYVCKDGDSRSHWSRRFIYHFPMWAAACDCCQRWRTLFSGVLIGMILTQLALWNFTYWPWTAAFVAVIAASAGWNRLYLRHYVKDARTYLRTESQLEEPK